jgi:putative thiamine transport system ATP-binding protein
VTLVIDRLCVAARGEAPLFPPLSLTVAPGTVTSVMGPSGIGKSTLLDAIGGHLARDWEVSGRVLLNGRDVTRLAPEARGIGVLFQEALLFPHLSVGDNLAFGLGARLRGRAARRAAVEEALAQAGLAGFHDRDPATLSGGQKARAALLRTLLAEPQALLLDEPFSRLDAGLRDDIRQFVFARVAERGIPALLVTHDEADAGAAGGPVLALSADT